MAKKITGYIKLQVPAGAANPSPPIGPALGQRGVNIMEFCKAFNAADRRHREGHAAARPSSPSMPIAASRSRPRRRRRPILIKKAANLKSGSKEPGKVSAGKIKRSQLTADRRDEDEGPERQRYRRGDAASSKAPPARWASKWWRAEIMAKLTKKQKAWPRSTARSCTASTRRSRSPRPTPPSKFDETIEVALNLGVDPRHADQMVRGVVTLPKGTGKTVRVGVFAKGAKADEATRSRRRRRRCRGPDGDHPGRHDRFRSLHRDART